MKQEVKLRLLQNWAKLEPAQLLNYLEVHSEITANNRYLIQQQLAQVLIKKKFAANTG